MTRLFVTVYLAATGYQLFRETVDHMTTGLTNGAGRPLGDDFVNFWSAPVLALSGRAAEIYRFDAFHAFQTSAVGATLDFHEYSYPPVLLLLTAPLALVPYVPALAAWVLAGLSALWVALREAMPGRQAALWIAVAPAVALNMVCGQNGAFTAALLGGGLAVLQRRPWLAGCLFGSLVFKPHLAVLLPVALVAGRQWRAIAGAAASGAVLVAASLAVFGPDLWANYAANTAVFRVELLEHAPGLWRRMVSVFAFARSVGAEVPVAYALQTACTLAAAALVGVIWWRGAPFPLRAAALVLGSCFATPYLYDYDLVLGLFVAAWLAPVNLPDRLERPATLALAALLVLPYLANPIGLATGIAPGPLLILPALLVTLAGALGRPFHLATRTSSFAS